jgi:maltooligosyltrehalose trehalohydrolase
VREGRRREFASFTRFGGEDIPDPNACETFVRSRVAPTGDDRLHRTLLKLRHDAIVPRLPGARTLDGQVLGPAAVLVRWRMGDGAILALAANLGPEPAAIAPPDGKLLFATDDRAIAGGSLAARSTAVFLEPAP